jgi:cytosine/adenosine deaminase-related metal-dependent hydrolase
LYTARQRARDAAALSPAQAIDLATAGGARCLGRSDVGRLAPGCRADVVVWPGDDLADVVDPLAGLVLGPDRRARLVYVGGEAIVGGGAPRRFSLAEARRDLARRARRLWP